MTVLLDNRLHFETLLADLSAQFVNLPPEQVDGSIEEAQRRIVEVLDLDRSVLFQFEGPATELIVTHLWARPEFPPAPRRTSGTQRFPWAAARILRGESLCFTTPDELPSPDRDSVRHFGTKSSVIHPLIVGGNVIGALAFGTLRQERAWSPEVVTRLRLLADVFANALSRKKADEDLRQAMDEVRSLRDQLQEENAYLRAEVTTLHGPSLVVGQSLPLLKVLAQVAQVAPTGATVLLHGETGTGKELFATHIHSLSPRRDRTMVRVNCAAIPSALIESELFGREKGAYTGALSRQSGRFEVADKSTLFLDEVGDLPLEIQIKLLRVLEEREVERLGSTRPIKVDVRIIAATNRDLEQAIEQGRFREDLYYRLNVFPVRIPPLRERPDDVPQLVWQFIEEFAKTLGKRVEVVSKENMLALQRYSWPGNVRELRNIVERAVIVATGPRLTIDVPRRVNGGSRHSSALMDVEREHIRSVLSRVNWRIRGTGGGAELLGMKPSTLESRMVKLGIQRPKH